MEGVDSPCEECGTNSEDDGAAGWHAYLVGDEDEGTLETVFYCRQCAAREFGDRD